MRGLNLDHLRAFVAVAEFGSFSAAADRLNLTQPAVSLQVRQLEGRLGVRLLERLGRRVRPTQAGDEFLAHARRIDSAVAAAVDDMANHAAGARGRVRLGTGATACIYLLPPVLRELRRLNPDLEIAVSTGGADEIVKAVQENAIDVGLVTLPVAGRMLEVVPVLDDAFVAIASEDHFRLPDRVGPDDLARVPVVAYGPGGNTRRIVDGWFAAAGRPVKPVMELENVEAIKELVGVGLGCAVLPAAALRKGGTAGALASRPLSPPLARTLAVVFRRDKPLGRGLRETVEALGGLR